MKALPSLYLLVGCVLLVSCNPRESGGMGAPALTLSDPQKGNSFPHFTWSRHPAAFADTAEPVRYEIQIARDAAFRDLLDEDTVFLNRYVPDRPLPNGAAYWRVRAFPRRDAPEAWSDTGRFTIVPCEEIIHVSYDPSAHDHQPAAQAAIDRAIELNKLGKSVEVVFPKGVYRSRNLGKFFLRINGANGLVVNGNGSTVNLSDYDSSCFQIDGSRNVVVRDFIVDMPEQLPLTQGRVIAVNPENATVEIQLEEGFPTFDDNYFVKPEGHAKLVDPKIDGRLKTGAATWFLIAKDTIHKLGDRHYSFQIAPPSYPVDKGRVALPDVDPRSLVKSFEVGDRFVYTLHSSSSALVFATASEAITFYQIVDYASVRHYFTFSCSLINVLHCRMVMKEGRWFQGTADGIHCRGNKIGPWIEGVEMDGIGDDGIALYSRPMAIASVPPSGAPNRLIVKAENFSAEPGDAVAFFRPQTGKILLETKVKSVHPAGGNWDVEFENTVPSGLSFEGSLVDSDQIWNRSKSCGDFVVRNNRMLGIRRYGTVFRAKTGVIENNLFQGASSAAIMFLNETQYPNGLYPSDIIIRNNEIRDCAFDSGATAAIALLFKRLGGSEPAETRAPHGILIENNRISECLRPALKLWSVQDIVLRGNTVNGQPLDASDTTQVVLKNVSDIKWLPPEGSLKATE